MDSVNNCNVIRPLLSISRFETGKLCSFWQLPIYPDRSNQKIKFLRNRVRKQLIPIVKFFFNSKVEDVLLQLAEIVEFENQYVNQVTTSLFTSSFSNSIGYDNSTNVKVKATQQTLSTLSTSTLGTAGTISPTLCLASEGRTAGTISPTFCSATCGTEGRTAGMIDETLPYFLKLRLLCKPRLASSTGGNGSSFGCFASKGSEAKGCFVSEGSGCEAFVTFACLPDTQALASVGSEAAAVWIASQGLLSEGSKAFALLSSVLKQEPQESLSDSSRKLGLGSCWIDMVSHNLLTKLIEYNVSQRMINKVCESPMLRQKFSSLSIGNLSTSIVDEINKTAFFPMRRSLSRLLSCDSSSTVGSVKQKAKGLLFAWLPSVEPEETSLGLQIRRYLGIRKKRNSLLLIPKVTNRYLRSKKQAKEKEPQVVCGLWLAKLGKYSKPKSCLPHSFSLPKMICNARYVAVDKSMIPAVLPSAASLPTDAKVVWNKKQKVEADVTLTNWFIAKHLIAKKTFLFNPLCKSYNFSVSFLKSVKFAAFFKKKMFDLLRKQRLRDSINYVDNSFLYTTWFFLWTYFTYPIFGSNTLKSPKTTFTEAFVTLLYSLSASCFTVVPKDAAEVRIASGFRCGNTIKDKSKKKLHNVLRSITNFDNYSSFVVARGLNNNSSPNLWPLQASIAKFSQKSLVAKLTDGNNIEGNSVTSASLMNLETAQFPTFCFASEGRTAGWLRKRGVLDLSFCRKELSTLLIELIEIKNKQLPFASPPKASCFTVVPTDAKVVWNKKQKVGLIVPAVLPSVPQVAEQKVGLIVPAVPKVEVDRVDRVICQFFLSSRFSQPMNKIKKSFWIWNKRVHSTKSLKFYATFCSASEGRTAGSVKQEAGALDKSRSFGTKALKYNNVSKIPREGIECVLLTTSIKDVLTFAENLSWTNKRNLPSACHTPKSALPYFGNRRLALEALLPDNISTCYTLNNIFSNNRSKRLIPIGDILKEGGKKSMFSKNNLCNASASLLPYLRYGSKPFASTVKQEGNEPQEASLGLQIRRYFGIRRKRSSLLLLPKVTNRRKKQAKSSPPALLPTDAKASVAWKLRDSIRLTNKSITKEQTGHSIEEIEDVLTSNFFLYFDTLKIEKKERYWPILISFLPIAFQRRISKLVLMNQNWKKIRYLQVENFLAKKNSVNN